MCSDEHKIILQQTVQYTLPATNIWRIVRHSAFASILIAVACGLLVATVAGFAGDHWWFLELFAHFRPHYALVSLLLVIVCIAARNLVSAAVGLLCLVLNSVPVLAYFSQPPPAYAARGEIVKIVSANIGGGNSADIIAFIREHNPDVVLLIELTPTILAELQNSIDSTLPHTFAIPRSDYFGIGLFSRYPLEDRSLLDLGYRDVPAISVRIVTERAALRLVGVHLEWPMTPATSRGRNTQLHNLPPALRSIGEPTVLLGDFNLTRWAPRFGNLLDATGLSDTATGFGWQPTWPTLLPGLGITIDHCLASPSLRIRSHRTGPDVGSDHYPLIAEFEL